MSPTLVKGLLTIAAAAVAAVPYAFPALSAFAPVFAGISGMLVGKAHFSKPGDVTPIAVPPSAP